RYPRRRRPSLPPCAPKRSICGHGDYPTVNIARRSRQMVTLPLTTPVAKPAGSAQMPPLQGSGKGITSTAADTKRGREPQMTYVVTDNCIKCKCMDCVEVCPVECFYEGENMLVIHPDECIDCGGCEPECPAEAIKPDTEPGLDQWMKLNTEYAEKWPNITVKRDPPADATEFDGVAEKFEAYYSPEPGQGD